MMSGDLLELWTGHELEHCDSVRPGDYAYIPADVLQWWQSRDDTRCIRRIT